MNKTAIKTFAIWARNKLIDDITYKAGLLGITDKEIKPPLPQSSSTVQFFDIGTKDPYAITGNDVEQRRKLVEALVNKDSDHPTAFKNLVEEVAYTWFNRLIAVRFMEVNDYLPTRIRVLSSESPGKREPDLVTHPFDAELNYSQSDKQLIAHLQENNLWDELFRMLFIKQCNALNAVLPELFEKTNDYTELLMNVSFTDQDGVVFHLVNDIDEDDFKEAVEIIGWMYQYYNEERKNEVINIYKGTIKKEDIPAATQLFTTDWVVRYMVDNSLGRYWIERNPDSKLSQKLDFFVASKTDELVYINERVNPEEITFFDPCMGSGHILVYAFDVFMEIYRERGYSDRDAALSIVKNNLYGLDIDKRAYQLAYFAVMMKARSYNRRILTVGLEHHLAAIQESNTLNSFYCEGITGDANQNQIGEYLIDAYEHAKEIGSLLSVDDHDYPTFQKYLDDLKIAGQIDMVQSAWLKQTLPLMKELAKQAEIMIRKYAVVCTNPPYMNKMEGQLKKFVNDSYKPYSGDLFSVFMYRNFDYCQTDGYSAFMTPFVWMFIKTYQKLREHIIENKNIATLVQMEYSAFEEATVPICSFVLKNQNDGQNGLFIKLSDFKGGMEVQKNMVLEALKDNECTYFYETNDENFSKIPGMPIAYWVSEKLISIFENCMLLEKVAKPRKGLDTADNDRFLRNWFEVEIFKTEFKRSQSEDNTKSKKKWYPLNSGGKFRKWYGNFEKVINWENDGYEIINFERSYIRAKDYYFQEGISWTKISSSKLGVRYAPCGFIFDSAGQTLFPKVEDIFYILALLCSKISFEILKILNPTLNYQVGDFERIPVRIDKETKYEVSNIANECIGLSRTDWDSFETSWDFKNHPLLAFRSEDDLGVLRSYELDENGHLVDIETILGNDGIETAFERWQDFTELQFAQLKLNEEELNRILIDIYGLQDELTPEVADKDVTIRRANSSREIRSFISYAVGCMFGRYSLDTEGLAYAGGEWDEAKYQTFIPDQDNVLPITDEEYFEDDVVGLFIAFVKKVYGEASLEDNLDFIAGALGNKGNTSREIIRNYFLKDFFKDHCKVYQKRPIYWLFDSGKENGFKAIIYLHRYNADTIGNLRIDYLHRMQKVYESEMARMQETVDNSTNPRDVSAATKRKEKLIKQLKETKEYDEKIAHLALARIELDLDDGVKVNYEKVQTDVEGKKIQVLGKI